jgi:hypothetical protein
MERNPVGPLPDCGSHSVRGVHQRKFRGYSVVGNSRAVKNVLKVVIEPHRLVVHSLNQRTQFRVGLQRRDPVENTRGAQNRSDGRVQFVRRRADQRRLQHIGSLTPARIGKRGSRIDSRQHQAGFCEQRVNAPVELLRHLCRLVAEIDRKHTMIGHLRANRFEDPKALLVRVRDKPGAALPGDNHFSCLLQQPRRKDGTIDAATAILIFLRTDQVSLATEMNGQKGLHSLNEVAGGQGQGEAVRKFVEIVNFALTAARGIDFVSQARRKLLVTSATKKNSSRSITAWGS